MSLYDEAAVALIAEGAAGKDGVLYNIKPEEKLKATELITNGGFDTDSDWLKTAGVTISGGKARMSDTSDVYRRIEQQDVFTVGKTYRVSVNLVVNLGTVKIGTEASANSIGLGLGSGQHSFYFTADANDLYIAKDGAANGYDIEIDNVSVKEVEQAPLDFTFTRGSNLTATRVAPSGYIEKGRENLLLQSNQFDTTWTSPGVTLTSGNGGFDGSSTRFQVTSTAADGAVVQGSLTASGVQTFSVYAKAGTLDFLKLSTQSGNVKLNVDLTDGSIGTEGSLVIDSSATFISNGWYRVSMTFNASTTGVYIYPATADEDTSQTSGHIFIQYAQLEAGLVATDYIETHSTTGKAGILEDSPRFDYTGGGCPHLLMEPTRKNLVTYSEYAGGFTDVGTGTVTDNHSTSPEGVKNAFQLSESDTGFYRIEENITVSAENVGDHTLSVFVKKTTGSLSHYAGVQLDSARKYVIVDTTNGTANEHNGTANDSFSVEDFSDDYWRVIITNDLASAADYRIGLWPAISSDGTTISATATGSNVFYGVQLEKGAYATSYIPNHGTSAGVTRNDDVTNTVDFGDYMDGEDITWYVELDKNDQLIRDGSTTGIRLSTTDLNASSVKFYRSYAGAPDGIRTVVFFSDDENDNDPASHIITEAGPVKVIVRRVKSTGEFTIFYDGAQKYQAFAPANYGKLKTLKIDGEKQPLFINNMFLFDRALTDDECIALTT